MKRAAHFLLHPELSCSPPNDAMIRAYLELGFGVDLYATAPCGVQAYGNEVRVLPFALGARWLFRNAWQPKWRRYAVLSATSEDPIGIIGQISRIHRRPTIALCDEIKSGSYVGDAPLSWKCTCRNAIRRARLSIVNDEARVGLLRDYAGLDPKQPVIVYPGGYEAPPPAIDRAAQRAIWGIPQDALVIGVSGGFNMWGGADWLIEALKKPERWAVVQPLGIDPLARFLLGHIVGSDRTYIEPRRLEWHEAWSQAAAFDIGVAVYLHPGPQFQLMGISSNRLCMFLAMGVPVIASRQDSFRFLEQYDCGVLVDDAAGFDRAIETIRARLPQMKVNAKLCWDEYVATPRRYRELVTAMGRVLEL